ncbi:MAG TPA: PAS domain-containing protein [Rhodanobacteraceae bacterium]|nr:PAS domain-containing protein [Rhodanobacteraceae bacterium]
MAARASRGDEGNDMAERVRNHDWAATSLGPRQDWPQSLACAVDLMLASLQPVYIAWGPYLLSLYNDGYIPILGSKHPGALGKPFREVYAEVWEAFLPMLEATMAGHPQYVLDHPVPLEGRTSDAVSCFTFAWTPLRDDAGKVAGFYCTATETTEKVRLQQALRESEARHAFLLKLSDALRPLAEPGAVQETAARLLWEHLHADCCAYFEVDAGGRVAASHGVAGNNIRLSGRLRITDFGQTLLDGFAAGQTMVVDNVASDPRFSDAERGFWHASGLSGGLGVPLVKQGRLCALLALSNVEPREWTGVDVAMTEEVAERTWAAVARARAERAAHDSHAELERLAQKFDATLSTISDNIFSFGRDGRVLYANRTLLELWGLAPGEEVGKDLSELNFPPAFRQVVAAYVQRVFETGETIHDEGFYTSPTGVVGYYDYLMSPAFNPDGEVAYVVGSARDISDRRRKEHWLREQTRLLELIASERSLDTVLRNLCDVVARLNGSARAAVLLVDEERAAMVRAVATQIPPSFGQALTGAPISDPLVGMCSTAIHENKTITCTDIRHDERWSDEWRELCEAHDVLACHVTPVHDDKGVSRASLLLCFDQPHVLQPWERQLGDFAAHVASIAIQHERADRELRESEERLQLALDAAGMGTFVWYPDEDRGVPCPDLLQLFGLPPGSTLTMAQTLATLIHPDDRDRFAEAIAQASDPEGDGQLHAEVRVVHPDDSIHWLAISGQMFFDDSRRALRMVGAGADITAHKREAERRQVMIAELQHRTRNLIAVVRAISTQTLQSSDSLEHFRDEFDGRLRALADVQGLMSRSHEVPITIGGLVGMELHALGAVDTDERIQLEGPSVRIRDSMAQTLAMAIHELATNACKYGALASEHGRLVVRWRVVEGDGAQRLLIEWNEYGIKVRESTPARGVGYGRRLIEEALPYALEARTRYELADGKLHCSIDLPIPPKSQGEHP